MVKVCNIASKHWIIFLCYFWRFPINLPPSRAFCDSLMECWFMKMHEYIRRKVYLTYSCDKSDFWIRFMQNADLVTFSKDFILLSNRKPKMRTKRVWPQTFRPWNLVDVSFYRSKSTDPTSLETYLSELKVKRYRTYRADRYLISR